MLNGNHKELAPQRLDNLRELIRGNGVIRVEEICRRLQRLARHGAARPGSIGGTGTIRRVHGGAVSVESRLEEPVFDDKASIAAREKNRIAQAALQFVEAGRHDLSGRRQHGAGAGAAAARPDEPDGRDQFAARRARTGRARAATDFDRRRVAPVEPDDGGAADAAACCRNCTWTRRSWAPSGLR